MSAPWGGGFDPAPQDFRRWWDGPGAGEGGGGPSEPGTVKVWDGSALKSATVKGVWTGSAIAPASVKGVWNGSAIQPITGGA